MQPQSHSSLGGDGSAVRAAEAALASLEAASLPRRIRARDHTVWRPDPVEISDRLGWLGVVDWMRGRLPEIHEHSHGLKDEGVRDVVLLGMGGSSLAPEVFRQTFGSAPGGPRLHVLDTTSPRRIRTVTEQLDPKRCHVLVSSKSGSTIEVQALLAHFRDFAGGVGDRFTAVTDPGTALDRSAQADGYRAVFRNDPEIGGRFSALSFFGMVPLSLLGVDPGQFLEPAERMAARCLADGPASENPGCVLGAVIGGAARAGRDKLTLLTSPALASFGLWVEQLVAESTGKDGVGIVPVVDEPLAPPSQLGEDRLFVVIRCGVDDNAALDSTVEALRGAGVPVYGIDVPDPYGLGAEMYRWMYATAVAGCLLGVQPFDQPDVQSTKIATGRLLEQLEAGGRLAVPEAGDDAVELLSDTQPGDYVALMIYGDPDAEVLDAARDLRKRLQLSRGLATTLGVGPRFLHSTGQLHKGGPETGVFLQLLLDEAPLPIPGRSFGFAELLAAQAAGDLVALREAGRRVARVTGPDPAAALRTLMGRIEPR
ncbi:MAG TPA: glucose-6-phosphate isomerase [bacterium]|nr:glucose-6-phosphate isomerase [bacterium]